MASEIKLPDIGDFRQVPIIEIHVKPGQVDATDERIAAQDLARPGCSQRVLVVDARVADPDHHVAHMPTHFLWYSGERLLRQVFEIGERRRSLGHDGIGG